jgi:hypothetical protein
MGGDPPIALSIPLLATSAVCGVYGSDHSGPPHGDCPRQMHACYDGILSVFKRYINYIEVGGCHRLLGSCSSKCAASSGVHKVRGVSLPVRAPPGRI